MSKILLAPRDCCGARVDTSVRLERSERLTEAFKKKKKKVPEGTFIHKDRRQIGRLVLHCIVGCLDGNFTFLFFFLILRYISGFFYLHCAPSCLCVSCSMQILELISLSVSKLRVN
jgi:hypothetical protein